MSAPVTFDVHDDFASLFLVCALLVAMLCWWTHN